MTTTADRMVFTNSGSLVRRFDVERVRKDFPILSREVNGRPLVYLDNAATSQKPRAVIDAISDFYCGYNANIHRGVHALSIQATQSYERARASAARFIGAASPGEIIFTRGTTEAVNLVAQTFGRTRLKPGDEILISGLEHHSNIVPWQILCEQTGAALRVVPFDDEGGFELDEFDRLLCDRTKLVAMAHVSNALGTILPVETIVERAHRRGAVVLLDGAQAVPHFRVNVSALDCEFYTFSSHKMFGPTGVGVLYGKKSLLAGLPPYQSGGEMIKSVTFQETVYNDVPHKFEAGTPDIAGVIGFGAAVEYIEALVLEAAAEYEEELLEHATAALQAIKGLRLFGTSRRKVAVLSFVLDGIHAHDLGTILDQMGIAVRTGHHCAQPVMDRFGVPATARASLAFYNTKGEIDALVAGIHAASEVFAS